MRYLRGYTNKNKDGSTENNIYSNEFINEEFGFEFEETSEKSILEDLNKCKMKVLYQILILLFFIEFEKFF
jgi:hypothetical protein